MPEWWIDEKAALDEIIIMNDQYDRQDHLAQTEKEELTSGLKHHQVDDYHSPQSLPLWMIIIAMLLKLDLWTYS